MIVDLAAEAGGNCELTEPGQIVERHGVTLIGTLNLPSSMAQHASQLYAKNVQSLVTCWHRRVPSWSTWTTRSCASRSSRTTG